MKAKKAPVQGLALVEAVQSFLDDHKVENIVTVDLRGKSSMADYFVIGTGRSQKHASMTATLLQDHLGRAALKNVLVEGLPNSEWVLIDAGGVIIHLFTPEARTLYNLEKMWGDHLQKVADTLTSGD